MDHNTSRVTNASKDGFEVTAGGGGGGLAIIFVVVCRPSDFGSVDTVCVVVTKSVSRADTLGKVFARFEVDQIVSLK